MVGFNVIQPERSPAYVSYRKSLFPNLIWIFVCSRIKCKSLFIFHRSHHNFCCSLRIHLHSLSHYNHSSKVCIFMTNYQTLTILYVKFLSLYNKLIKIAIPRFSSFKSYNQPPKLWFKNPDNKKCQLFLECWGDS